MVRHCQGDHRVRRMPGAVEVVFPAVLVLGIQRVYARTDDLVPFDRCLRCLLLVMCTHPFAKKTLTLHLVRSEGHESHFGCNLMHCKVLASSHQHLMAEAPFLDTTGYTTATNI